MGCSVITVKLISYQGDFASTLEEVGEQPQRGLNLFWFWCHMPFTCPSSLVSWDHAIVDFRRALRARLLAAIKKASIGKQEEVRKKSTAAKKPKTSSWKLLMRPSLARHAHWLGALFLARSPSKAYRKCKSSIARNTQKGAFAPGSETLACPNDALTSLPSVLQTYLHKSIQRCVGF